MCAIRTVQMIKEDISSDTNFILHFMKQTVSTCKRSENCRVRQKTGSFHKITGNREEKE